MVQPDPRQDPSATRWPLQTPRRSDVDFYCTTDNKGPHPMRNANRLRLTNGTEKMESRELLSASSCFVPQTPAPQPSANPPVAPPASPPISINNVNSIGGGLSGNYGESFGGGYGFGGLFSGSFSGHFTGSFDLGGSGYGGGFGGGYGYGGGYGGGTAYGWSRWRIRLRRWLRSALCPTVGRRWWPLFCKRRRQQFWQQRWYSRIGPPW